MKLPPNYGALLLSGRITFADLVRLNEPSPVEPVKNVAVDVKDTTWFIDSKVDLSVISHAEKIIDGHLRGYNVEYYREVSFVGLKLPTHGYPRFDFWFPTLKLCIEYDGRASHITPYQKEKDSLKTFFCRSNGIKLIRWNSVQFRSLGIVVSALLKEHGIKSHR